MRGERHRDSLSAYDRSRLAEIEASLRADDPEWCAGFRRRLATRGQRWVVIVLLVAGAALAIGTFTVSVWVATAGLGCMGLGLWLGRHRAHRASRRVVRWFRWLLEPE